MEIYKITEASEYLGVSINTLKTLANNGKIKSFKTTGEFKTQVGVFGRFAARMNPLRRFADQIAVINMTNLPSTGR